MIFLRTQGIKYFVLFILLLILFNPILTFQATHANPEPIFPSNGWPRRDPEDLGFNTTILDRVNRRINTYHIAIDSIQIVRYGYLCYDEFFDFYDFSNIHHMKSVTKSVIATLIGIAHSKGLIPDLDEPVLDIFSDRIILNNDSRKQAMTIRHLLRMQSGFAWNEFSTNYFTTEIEPNNIAFLTNTSNVYPGTWPEYFNHANDITQFIQSSDWIQFILDTPMATDPGTEFNYNTAVSHLLAAILQNKTGVNPENFANQYLFTPLNITDYLWWQDPMGLTIGGSGLWLRPHDMLKIGYLYLNNGTWNGLQIVTPDWVLNSTKNYSPELELIGNGYGYGYQWWMDLGEGYYFADGLGGQHIIVVPEKDLVVVFTAWDSRSISLCNTYILNSIFADLNDSEIAALKPSTTTTGTITTTTEQISSFSIFLGTAALLIVTGFNRKKKRSR
jgi:CubicO group peptidase (beta-lactamase class C family)